MIETLRKFRTGHAVIYTAFAWILTHVAVMNSVSSVTDVLKRGSCLSLVMGMCTLVWYLLENKIKARPLVGLYIVTAVTSCFMMSLDENPSRFLFIGNHICFLVLMILLVRLDWRHVKANRRQV